MSETDPEPKKKRPKQMQNEKEGDKSSQVRIKTITLQAVSLCHYTEYTGTCRV